MTITGSPDINTLEVQVTWDISGTLPAISLVNLSTGDGLANVDWWFDAKSPSGTKIHLTDSTNIAVTGAWTTRTLSDSWPKPFKSVEWSGAPYTITIYARDSAGTVFSITKTASICHPNGNTQLSKNPYGLANIYIKVICERGRVYFEDRTTTTWKGIEGVRISSALSVAYPLDASGTIPDPFRLTKFSNVEVPISYASDNYQFSASSIYDYDFGDYVHVRIKYIQQQRFSVLCNIDLSPLACGIVKLVDDLQNGNCQDVADANRKLGIINGKFALVMMGKIEPLTGIDVPKLIREIEEIGGFDCDCCNTPSGIIPDAASTIDGYTFDINHVGGDVNGTVTQQDTVITFNLHDISYVFAMYPGSPNDTSAFTVSNATSVDGYTKTYYLHVSGSQLAEDLPNIILGNAELVNLWRSIFAGSLEFDLTVDGGCIFHSTATCDYDFVLNSIPDSSTYALLTGIRIRGVTHSLNFSFNLTSTSALQTYLNALGFGDFDVSMPNPNPGGLVYISSDANPNNIESLTFKISGTTYTADLTKVCTGYVAISANEVVQNIVNYLCNLDESQIKTSIDYTVTYIDLDGVLQSVTVDVGSSLSDLIQELLDRGNTSVTWLQSNAGATTCAKMKEIFPVNVNAITSTDFLFGTKGNGACSQVSYMEAFNYMLSAGITNSTALARFCAMVAACGNGLTCEPYEYLEVYVTDYDQACTGILGIQYTIT